MRNKSVDIIRGMLMLYIVAVIHGVFWLELIPRPFSSVLLFEMPLIFLVSGYSFALFSNSTGFKLSFLGYLKYSVSRLTRLLVPYYGYSIVCVLTILAYTQGSDSINVIRDWINPFLNERLDPFGLLTSHLWFIPPFIIVTLALPLISSIKLPIWSTVIPLCVAIFVLQNYFDGSFVTHLFYLYWTWVGYRLAVDVKINAKKSLAALLVGIVLLFVSGYFLDVTMDMQTNKFPPNSLFFVFSSVWVSFFLLISTLVKPNNLSFLEDSKLFKPFIKAGYSIYLWQGFGYIIAINACKLLGLPKPFEWAMAVVFSVLMGLLFSPLEKVRWRFKTSAPAH